MRRRTKLLATLGPASSDAETIHQRIHHGLDGARLNFSHGTHTDHARFHPGAFDHREPGRYLRNQRCLPCWSRRNPKYVTSQIPGMMPNITLALDQETATWVKPHPEVSWSEVARQAIKRKIRELHALGTAFADSELDQSDIDDLAQEAKARLLAELEDE